MSKMITVVGATGIQGGSVIQALLQNPDYSLRALTRSKHSDNARALQAQGVQVVEADLNEPASLEAAFAESYAIYAVTNFFEPLAKHGVEKAMEIETQQGINMAKAAAATPTLRHYIWSTLPNSRVVSGGRIEVPYYQSKRKVDDYIKTQAMLLAKTTFLWVPVYASNIQYPWSQPFTIPSSAEPTKLYQIQTTPASTINPLVGDETVNVGLFVERIFAQPQKTLTGKYVLAMVEMLTSEELLATWAKAQGKESEVLVVQPEAYFRMWPGVTNLVHLSASYWNMMGDKTFSGEKDILRKDDLGVQGLVGTAEAFAKILSSS